MLDIRAHGVVRPNLVLGVMLSKVRICDFRVALAVLEVVCLRVICERDVRPIHHAVRKHLQQHASARHPKHVGVASSVHRDHERDLIKQLNVVINRRNRFARRVEPRRVVAAPQLLAVRESVASAAVLTRRVGGVKHLDLDSWASHVSHRLDDLVHVEDSSRVHTPVQNVDRVLWIVVRSVAFVLQVQVGGCHHICACVRGVFRARNDVVVISPYRQQLIEADIVALRHVRNNRRVQRQHALRLQKHVIKLAPFQSPPMGERRDARFWKHKRNIAVQHFRRKAHHSHKRDRVEREMRSRVVRCKVPRHHSYSRHAIFDLRSRNLRACVHNFEPVVFLRVFLKQIAQRRPSNWKRTRRGLETSIPYKPHTLHVT
mmetsp:Transcript_1938/g.4253  ORF Transcript_1938/g.4253 Transcript_1938/m.4253 type:complete len:373 (+) Transcript_1938:95-1213(+)